MQQEALAIIFISWWILWSCIEQAGRFVSQGPDCTHSDCVHTIFNSLCCYFPCIAPYLKDSIITSKWWKFFHQLGWFSRAFFLESLILESIFNSFCFETLIVMFFSCSFSLGAGHIVKGLNSQEQCKDLISGWTKKRWHDANIAKHDRSMIAADAMPPSVQWSASVVFGDVMEIAKLMGGGWGCLPLCNFLGEN